MGNFEGVLTALVTPFKNGVIDFSSLGRLIDEQLAADIDGIVVLGTTGESPTVTAAERLELWKFIKQNVGTKLPLLMGTGSNSTEVTRTLTIQAEELGADGALIVTPYYNKPPQRGLVAHYTRVAQAVSLPILLYNVPSRCITSMDIWTLSELSKLPNIVGVKEASGNMDFGRQISEQCGNDFLLTSGDDGSFLSLAEVGGRGVISVMSNLAPHLMKAMWQQMKDKTSSAEAIFAPVRELNDFLYCEANPIPLKQALFEKGLIDSNELRLPLVPLAEERRVQLKTLLQGAGIL
jgi:4-hydroxy-tetrahydrodipicolinate synthase